MYIQVKTIFFALILLLGGILAEAQQKLKITVEDIWAKPTFAAKSVYGVNWMKDGRYYSSQVPDNANKVTDIVKVIIQVSKEHGPRREPTRPARKDKNAAGKPVLY